MDTLKIQKIRWCTSCQELLPLKCEKCVKCPDRKPKPVEVFGWPPILATRDCGCIQIACQRPDCGKRFWRHVPARGKGGQAKHRQQYCSPACWLVVARQIRSAKTIMTPCSECKKPTYRKPCHLKTYKRVFCGRPCFLIAHARGKYGRVVVEDEASPRGPGRPTEDLTSQMLECRAPKHFGEITEHLEVKGTKLFECTGILAGKKCGHRRTAHYNVERGLVAA